MLEFRESVDVMEPMEVDVIDDGEPMEVVDNEPMEVVEESMQIDHQVCVCQQLNWWYIIFATKT